jgi:outer membrane protein assembly factor BamB
MHVRSYVVRLAPVVLLAGACSLSLGQDWNNLGGNGRCNGLSNVVGPDGVGASDLLWENALPSFIAWNPVAESRRVFVVRQTGFPPDPPAGSDSIYALDLDTGAILWTVDLPYETGDWTTWIAGVKDGRLYASRSGNGGSVAAPIYCLDAATGAVLWHTAGGASPLPPRYEITAGPYTGAVFAPDGDILFGSNRWVERVDAMTGAAVWRTARTEQVGNTTGVVIEGNGVYTVDLIAGSGNRIAFRKFDLATGAFLYRGPFMAAGGLLHNAPYIGVDGRLYINTGQNFNINYDFLYSYTDTGTAIVENWRTSSGGGGEFSRWGVGPDGSIYSASWTGAPDPEGSFILQRINPADGQVIATYPTPITGDYMQFHMAVDARGVIYLSNGTAGGFNGGRLYSFNPDLTLRWSEPIDGNLNQGSPILATDGTMIVASTGTILRAYRTAATCNDIDFNNDGSTFDPTDIDAFFSVFSEGPCIPATATCNDIDFNNDGSLFDPCDIDSFLLAFSEGPCTLCGQ